MAMSTPKDSIHARTGSFIHSMPRFFPWADPPVGSHDRQYGTREEAGEASKTTQIITQAGTDAGCFWRDRYRGHSAGRVQIYRPTKQTEEVFVTNFVTYPRQVCLWAAP